MAFSVDKGSPREMWFPLDIANATFTAYVGQLVSMPAGYNGITAFASATGAGDTTRKQVLLGIVKGTNDWKATYKATYGQYITAVQTLAAQQARTCLGNSGGMSPTGDTMPLAKVQVCDATTIIRGNIYNATIGTAPTVVTATAVTAAGVGFTTGAIDFTTVAELCTCYCRSGKNQGIYRIVHSASTTTHTFSTYWPYELAVGDTFVFVPLKRGISYCQVNTTSSYQGMFIDCSQGPATNYFIVDVLELDLKEAGKESALFRFAPCHFDLVRA